ncbi:Regulator of polyketide synthase expression-like protein [Rubrobacter xylanophilus DSM 9941]|uniref:Regulator of polyketide synthase expression-like protein n=2 Tax=Rubrobacter xylanophilus TaxID=49319 RepID=Q1ATK4_RUBXD|nr:helix-turn-helix domain-containing protein [Rubrobacter xylanophilus]ABG05274.1 Regulator of polyketide synthase expression-like protein [Rubrobacter xylanophilus DSM 9941]
MRGWEGAAGLLRRAALEPAGRGAWVRLALEEAARAAPAAGTLLARPDPAGRERWLVEYAGAAPEEVRRWAAGRLGSGEEEPGSGALWRGAPCLPDAPPRVFRVAGGLWVLWAFGPLEGRGPELFRGAVEELIQVERREREHLGGGRLGELVPALRSGDEECLPELLELVRRVGRAEFAYWGGVHDGVVEVRRHVGARSPGFGFELPLGEGVGGRAFAGRRPLEVADYLNCQYRYPGVSDATDSEGVRSVLALPIGGREAGSGAVLYAVRRSVAPFSGEERALLARLRDALEPLETGRGARRAAAAGPGALLLQRAGLRRLLLGSDRVREVEEWLEGVLRCRAVLVDAGGRPYAPESLDRLERLRLAGGRPRSLPLSGGRGSLLVWGGDLRVEGWPDLMEDVLAAFRVILDRAERAHERLNSRRSRWLRAVAAGQTGEEARREGHRLGLPEENGEVWAFAWEPDRAGGARLRMVADEVALDMLDVPFITLEEGLGAVLVRGRPAHPPSAVRDALLRHFGPAPLWLVHGAGYESLEGLEEALAMSLSAAEDLRRSRSGPYVCEVRGRGLDSLLDDPRLSGELSGFAGRLLEPLLEHDGRHGTRLTETFCLALALGSAEAAADRLFVHPNTVRYRLRRAQHLLGRDLSEPKERTALGLAAFVWLRDRDGRGASEKTVQRRPDKA